VITAKREAQQQQSSSKARHGRINAAACDDDVDDARQSGTRKRGREIFFPDVGDESS
jgi:hypothetical protein